MAKLILTIISISIFFGKEILCATTNYESEIIDTNDFIISPIFSGDTIKTIVELKTKYKNESQFKITPKTEDKIKLRLLASLISNSFSLYLHCNNYNNVHSLLVEISRTCSLSLNNLIIENINLLKLPDEILLLPQLRSLNINSSKLQDFPKCIYDLENLLEIGFSGSSFEDMPEGISKLINLNVIEFNDCKIKSLSNDFSELISIKEIKFNWCENLNLSKLLTTISNIKNTIVSVNFNHCNITNIPNEIALLTNVRNIYMIGNNISSEEIKRIEKSFPYLKINIW